MALACELLAWTQMLALAGAAPRWEPKRLRLRLFSVAGRLASSGRRLRLRRNCPPASPPIRLTSRNSPGGKEGETTRARGTPAPARRDGRATWHGRTLENQSQPDTSGHQRSQGTKDRGW